MTKRFEARKSARSSGENRLMAGILKAAREEAGLSQRELGARMSRPQSYVAKYESAERRVDAGELVRICEALGADPLALFKEFLSLI